MNKETLKEQQWKQQRNKASGIGKVTKDEYEMNLESNLENLISRMKKISYKPLPVRRAYIPKENGKLRPLGIPAYEDKLVQGVMANILSEIYECKFLNCSYWFRPNRNYHQAIRKINQGIMINKVNYILECDIKVFFYNVDHKWLMKVLEYDIQDEVFLRYVNRFLISGYMEDMKSHEMDKGTLQGGLISPILANVYLHYVLDLYFEKYIKPRLKGKAYLARYADDFLIMFQYEKEAKQVYEMLDERLVKFGLEMEQEKTRMLPFGRFKWTNETFDFLGFMHYNGKIRTGKYCVGHKMSKKKRKSKHKSITKWIKEHKAYKFKEIIEMLNKKLTGLYAYYGINGMLQELYKIYFHTIYALRSSIFRRSQRRLSVKTFNRILERTPITKNKIYKDIWCFNI